MRIAVFHHPTSFFPLDIFQRVHDSTELIWVVDSSEWRSTRAGGDVDRRLLRRLGSVLDVVGLDADETADRLSAHRPDGVVSFVDDTIVRAAETADRLGLTFHSPQVAEGVVDKQRQREALEREGLPSARFWPVPQGMDGPGVAEFARRVTYPAVLKPVRGSGSLDIHRIGGPDELVRLLLAHTGDVPWLVEEYIPDDEDTASDWYANYLSVESVVSRGEVSHVAFCGRFPLAEPFRETGNFIPAIFDPASEQPMLRLVEDAVRALGIRDSVLHTEIKLTADGPRLIEVNGRLGGRPPFVLETVSPVNLFAVACQVATGVPVKFEHPVPTDGVGFWLMMHGPTSARRVRGIEGLDRLAALDGVDVVRTNRGPGEPLDWRSGTDAHVLAVRGRTADHAELAELVATIRRSTVLTFED
jgi:predicted ATP-grasp superfamily ATP-dependent carboligase